MTDVDIHRRLITWLRTAAPGHPAFESYRSRYLASHAAATDVVGDSVSVAELVHAAVPQRLVKAVAPLLLDPVAPEPERRMAKACLLLAEHLDGLSVPARTAAINTITHLEWPSDPPTPLTSTSALWETVLVAAPPTYFRRAFHDPKGWVWRTALGRVAGRWLLAAASHDGRVYLTDLATGALRLVLKGHQGPVSAVVFAIIDGADTVVTAGFDRTIRLWDAVDGSPRGVLQGHPRGLWDVAVGEVADRTVIASASADCTVRLWDPGQGGVLSVLSGHRDWVWRVAFGDRNGQPIIASGSDDATVRVWDVLTGETIAVLTAHTAGISAVQFARYEGQPVLVSGSFDGTIRMTELESWSTIRTLTGHTDWIRDVRVVHGGHGATDTLVSCGDDGVIRVWNPSSGESVSMTGSAGSVYTCATATTETGVWIASGGVDHIVRVWEPPDLAAAGARLWADDSTAAVSAVATAPAADGCLIAAGDEAGALRLWRIPRNRTQPPEHPEEMLSLRADTGRVTVVELLYLHGAPVIASAGVDTSLRLWDAKSGNPLATLGGQAGPITTVGTRPVAGSVLLAMGDAQGDVRLWDVARQEEIRVIKAGADWVGALILVTVGRRLLLVIGCYDGTIMVVDPLTGEVVDRLQSDTHAVTAMRATATPGCRDQVGLLTAGADGAVRSWRLTPSGIDRRSQVVSWRGDRVLGVATTRLAGRALVASVTATVEVQLQDLTDEFCERIPLPYPGRCCAMWEDLMVVGMDRGLLALRLDHGVLAQQSTRREEAP